MHLWAPILALFAAVVIAQQNAINVPPGGLQITADELTTITWTNPSSGTVTIKLQQGSGVTPESGIILATGIPASAETASFIIHADQVNNAQYSFEIIDDTNPNNYNFSPGFTVTGAKGTGVTTSGSPSSSAFPTAGANSSAAASTTNASAAASSSNSSKTTSSKASSTSSSQNSAGTTSVANTNGGSSLKAQGALVAAMIGAIAVF